MKKNMSILKKQWHWSKLVAAILICQGAGLLGSVFTAPNIEGWYATLVKPEFSPSNFLFAPVWTTLFVMMGVALYLLWVSKEGVNRRLAVRWFIVQLGLNVLWSVLFFGAQNPLLALVEIGFLWVAILLALIYGYRVNRWVGWLLLPYLAWVSFASVLNFYIVRLN